jgi:hypothetical protein
MQPFKKAFILYPRSVCMFYDLYLGEVGIFFNVEFLLITAKSDQNPDPHGSANGLAPRIRIRIETIADLQHCLSASILKD